MSSPATQPISQPLQLLANADGKRILTSINRGIEKESLRITPTGELAQTAHPRSLGSPLTHSSITTDYSEALMEFITPVSPSIEDSLSTLEDIHVFVQQQLDEEILWAASMPCIVSGDEGIPIAKYGSSNVARMKEVYRYGLGNRYGRLMQAISGIHYNFSMPQTYWQTAWEAAGKPDTLMHYINERYLGLIRNFRRYSWLLIYLFGASPAVCASFLRGRKDHDLQPFDEQGKSLFLPYGTSLRMGDLGYNSDAQKNLNICYNSLDNYVETLRCAIRTPHPDYQSIPSGQEGHYQQLNDSLLQIENEFYSPIRPKRVTHSGETPLGALKRGGIEYIEVRCIDVNPFTPLGLDAQQIRFIDTFLLYCLLADSPLCDDMEQQERAMNLAAVVNRGREPGLKLTHREQEVSLSHWSTELLDAMKPIAQLFDIAHDTSDYTAALTLQQTKIDDPTQTPSARVLAEMQEKHLPFFRLAMQYSERWAQNFTTTELSPDVQQRLQSESTTSLEAQRTIEAADDITFEAYLERFYCQYDSL